MRITESQLRNIVKRILREQSGAPMESSPVSMQDVEQAVGDLHQEITDYVASKTEDPDWLMSELKPADMLPKVQEQLLSKGSAEVINQWMMQNRELILKAIENSMQEVLDEFNDPAYGMSDTEMYLGRGLP